MRHSASRKRHGRRKALAGNRRRLLLLPALLLSLVLGIPNGALAYWTTTGSGSATGTSGNLLAPTNIAAAQSPGQRSATIAWSASTSSNVTGYRAEHSTDSGSTWAIACGGTLAPTATLCSDTNLMETGSYVFRVTALKGSWTATSSVSSTVKIDTTKPTVTVDRAETQPASTRITPINYRIVFSEQVFGFSASSVTLTLGGSNVAATRQLTAIDATTYNLAVDGISANGQSLVATIVAGAVSDAAGNTSSASTSSVGNSVLLDNVAPGKPAAPHLDASIDSNNDNVTNAASLIFRPNGTIAADAPVGTTVTLYRSATENGPASVVPTTTTTVTAGSGGVTTYSLVPTVGTTANAEETYWYSVRYTDGFGNTSAESDRQKVVVDRLVPTAPTNLTNTVMPAGLLGIVPFNRISGNYVIGDNNGYRIDAHSCALSATADCGSNPQQAALNNGTFTVDYSRGALSLGAQMSIWITVTDLAGNKIGPVRFNVTS